MRQGQLSDELLMELVSRGGRDSLDILVRRHASPLLTFITRMIGDRYRSEEIFQEVFLTVWIKRRQYDQLRRFKPWLYQITINKCRETFRRRSLPISQMNADDLSSLERGSSASSSQTTVATESNCLVAEAVAALPEKQKTVLVLRIWSRLSYAEISKLLNQSEATVRSNMHHALAGLRAYLEPRMR